MYSHDRHIIDLRYTKDMGSSSTLGTQKIQGTQMIREIIGSIGSYSWNLKDSRDLVFVGYVISDVTLR